MLFSRLLECGLPHSGCSPPGRMGVKTRKRRALPLPGVRLSVRKAAPCDLTGSLSRCLTCERIYKFCGGHTAGGVGIRPKKRLCSQVALSALKNRLGKSRTNDRVCVCVKSTHTRELAAPALQRRFPLWPGGQNWWPLPSRRRRALNFERVKSAVGIDDRRLAPSNSRSRCARPTLSPVDLCRGQLAVLLRTTNTIPWPKHECSPRWGITMARRGPEIISSITESILFNFKYKSILSKEIELFLTFPVHKVSFKFSLKIRSVEQIYKKIQDSYWYYFFADCCTQLLIGILLNILRPGGNQFFLI